MAKKTDTTTKPASLVKPATPTTPVVSAVPAGPAKAAPSAKPVAPVKRAAKPTAKSKPAAKSIKAKAPAAKASAVKTKKTTKATAKPLYTRDDIALRAYFIAEKRRAHGHHGDEHQDWVEAERQLAAEGVKPKKLTKA